MECLYEDGGKPEIAMLMSDFEGAIDMAWGKSDWKKLDTTGKCVKHGQWATADRTMPNGEKFGHKRAAVWFNHVFATCEESFRTGVGVTSAEWRAKGDIAGAEFLLQLAAHSKAPLCRWPSLPCPFIGSGAGESVNQLFKGSKPGEKRRKLTLVQLVRKVLLVGYRSSEVLREGPQKCREQRTRAENQLLKNKGKMDSGTYVLLRAGLQQLTWRAFEIFSRAAGQAGRHTACVGEWRVWSNYQAIAAPNVKYVHKIVPVNGTWTCVVARTGKPCWENKIRGLFCSHMCAYAQKLIAAGGNFDHRLIGRSSIPRHRAVKATQPACELPTQFAEPRLTTPAPLSDCEVDLSDAVKLLKQCAARAGTDGIQALKQLMQLRLLGGQAGDDCHKLADAFMVARVTRMPAAPREHVTQNNVRYSNHVKSPSKLQKKRDRNKGDVRMYASGRRSQRREHTRVNMTGVTLTGKNVHVGKNSFSLEWAKQTGLLDPVHRVHYISPFTAPRDEDQYSVLNRLGMYRDEVIGLDLEYSGPVYPTKRKRGQVYDASMLILSNRLGTVLYHLYQFQEANADCMHWPGPYVSKQLVNGKWQ